MITSAMQRRSQLLRSEGAPTLAETHKQLGPELTDTMLRMLGHDKHFIVWADPTMEEDKCSTCDANRRWRHFSSEHLKTITHNAIIRLGEQYVKLYDKQNDEMRDRAIAVDTDRVLFKSSLMCLRNNEAVLMKERRLSEIKHATLLKLFKLSSAETLNSAKLKMKRDAKKEIGRERAELAALLEDKMKFAVEETAKEVHAECEEQERIRSEELKRSFSAEIMKMTHDNFEMMKEAEERYKKNIGELKNQLETQHLQTISDTIKTEQNNCFHKVNELTHLFETTNRALKMTIEQNETEIVNLQDTVQETSDRLSVWEKKAVLILKEFQKFIDYIHNAVQGQADHMLSIERPTEDVLSTLSLTAPETDIRHSQRVAFEPVLEDVAVQTKTLTTADKSVMTLVQEDIELTVSKESTDSDISKHTEIHFEYEPSQDEELCQIEQYLMKISQTTYVPREEKIQPTTVQDIDIGEICINLSEEDIDLSEKTKERDAHKFELTDVLEEETTVSDVDVEIQFDDIYAGREHLDKKIPTSRDDLAESHNDKRQSLTDLSLVVIDEAHEKMVDLLRDKQHDVTWITHMHDLKKYLAARDHEDIQQILSEVLEKASPKTEQPDIEAGAADKHTLVEDVIQDLRKHPSLMHMIIS